MDKRKVGRIRTSMDEALQIVRDEYKLELVVKTIRFSQTGFRVTLEASEVNEDGTNATQKKDWDEAVSLGEVKKEWLGMVLKGGYKVTGYNWNARKNCIILDKEGKTYTTSKQSIERELQFRALGLTKEKVEDIKQDGV
ncbi:MAG: hypothetical protein CMB80_01870 [Flammeovirgaceae bacterium]|nr:hypothetical protein [Flammeovirgaceae bacterium]